jgi:Fe-S cluster assembly ATPase SufC
VSWRIGAGKSTLAYALMGLPAYASSKGASVSPGGHRLVHTERLRVD